MKIKCWILLIYYQFNKDYFKTKIFENFGELYVIHYFEPSHLCIPQRCQETENQETENENLVIICLKKRKITVNEKIQKFCSTGITILQHTEQ